MLWVMYSQWDQGLCWTVMTDIIWSVICHSHLQLPRVSWKVELLGRTFHLYNGPKVQTKQYLGRHHRVTLQLLPLLFLKHKTHAVFSLGLWKFLVLFYFIVVIFWDLIHYFFMMCSLPVYNASTSNQLTNSVDMPLESLLSQEGMCILGTCKIAG